MKNSKKRKFITYEEKIVEQCDLFSVILPFLSIMFKGITCYISEHKSCSPIFINLCCSDAVAQYLAVNATVVSSIPLRE